MRGFLWSWLLSSLLLLAGSAAAQETMRLDAQVTFIAGQNAYLNVGRDAGLTEGDTVQVSREDQRLGALVVVSATADRAVMAFVGAPFPLTLGDRLTLALAAPEPRPAPTQPDSTVTAAPPDRPSLLDQPATQGAAERSYARTPRLSGRLQIGTDGLLSTTRSTSDGPSVDRTFATPFAALRAGVENLPGGLRLDANLRAAYRYADPTPLAQPADVRVYQFSLEKTFAALPLEVRAGRFYNRYDRFSGYWDGLSLHLGSPEQGVGVSAGFQPDRADEAPSGDFPKYTAFAHRVFEVAEGARLDGTILAGQVLPRAEGMQTRTFVGAQQRLYAPNLTVSADALADQDPDTGDWVLSRLSGRVTLKATDGVRLRAYALSRRPYLLFGDRQTLLDRSTRLGGGATVTLRGGPLPGLSLRADLSNAMTEGRPSTLTASGGVSLARLPSLGIGLSADATVWQQDDDTGLRRGYYGGAGLSRSFGAAYGRLGYRYQQTPLFGAEALVTHGLDVLVQVPLTRRAALTLQANSSFGDRLTSTRLYTALWYRF